MQVLSFNIKHSECQSLSIGGRAATIETKRSCWDHVSLYVSFSTKKWRGLRCRRQPRTGSLAFTLLQITVHHAYRGAPMGTHERANARAHSFPSPTRNSKYTKNTRPLFALHSAARLEGLGCGCWTRRDSLLPLCLSLSLSLFALSSSAFLRLLELPRRPERAQTAHCADN